MYSLIELEMDSSRKFEAQNNGRMIPAQEACGQISEVVQEAVRKLEMVAEEKLRKLKKAQLAYDSCDQELEEKKKEVAELKLERQQKRQQIEELDSIVRLKEAEADMFQQKADEARREAERIQRIALSKYEKSEEEYACRYLKLRLSEAEVERQYLFEKMKLQDNPRSTKSNSIEDSTQVLLSKVQEILKNV